MVCALVREMNQHEQKSTDPQALDVLLKQLRAMVFHVSQFCPGFKHHLQQVLNNKVTLESVHRRRAAVRQNRCWNCSDSMNLATSRRTAPKVRADFPPSIPGVNWCRLRPLPRSPTSDSLLRRFRRWPGWHHKQKFSPTGHNGQVSSFRFCHAETSAQPCYRGECNGSSPQAT